MDFLSSLLLSYNLFKTRSAARLVCMTRKFDHITPTLIDIGFLLGIVLFLRDSSFSLYIYLLMLRPRRICLIFQLIVGARILYDLLVKAT